MSKKQVCFNIFFFYKQTLIIFIAIKNIAMKTIFIIKFFKYQFYVNIFIIFQNKKIYLYYVAITIRFTLFCCLNSSKLFLSKGAN